MDDTCAVCADTLEWAAYGPCGHRDVCSTCVARLRFICDDRRCCICKTESHLVFVTKALGDYTRMINDFSLLPSEVKEGRCGSYWYHEDTQSLFEDVDHYKMIKAMCKLSCSECDKMDEQPSDGPKRRARFRNIEQLKGHLFHKHKRFMCSLCLEGRKVFICEQKLYTRAQLNQHINTGDSEVDGTEIERCGFSGHPMCDFCRTPFYGDNELYTHMSTEHYTCHMCQRQNPGKYEYFKNYDDLEIHFRSSHFLCEDEACLAKKFVVFQSEAEMKRHNALEHGGRMSRSKRNAALQIPTSFMFNDQAHDRGRGRGRGRSRGRGQGRTSHHDFSENQISMAIQASLETNTDCTNNNTSSSHRGLVPSEFEDSRDVDPIIQPFESLTTAESESSRYLQALGHARNSRLEESSFPPLAMAPGTGNSQLKPQHDSDGSSSSSMAAHLRRKNKRNTATVINSGQAWPAASRGPPHNSAEAWPAINSVPGVSWGSSQNKASASNAPGPSTYANSTQSRPTTGPGQLSSGTSRDKGQPRRIIHSASAPNLAENGFTEPSISDFPPVSAQAQMRPLPSSSQPKADDVQTANKSLVEKIRAALDNDEEKYTSFKTISAQYRQGTIDTERYLNYVRHFNLLHLVLDLARLCPDPEKQKELIETYNASVRSNAEESSRTRGNASKKGKGKALEARDDSSKDTLADNFLSTVRKLHSDIMASDEVEVLSKDGYRGGRGKSTLVINDRREESNYYTQPAVRPSGSMNLPSTDNGKSIDGANASGGSKQKKKTSKFNRVRLGDDSVAARSGNSESNQDSDKLDGDNSAEGLPVRGVWRRGGVNKLFP